jgi:hypothetical protein
LTKTSPKSLNEEQQNQKSLNQAKVNRHMNLQKHHHQNHQRQLKEFDEDSEMGTVNEAKTSNSSTNEYSSITESSSKQSNESSLLQSSNTVELKISYACILIGCSPNLDFLPTEIVNDLALDPTRLLNTKDNPIGVDRFTYETLNFKNLYAMGPLIGDNFIRFGTGGALAITSSIVRSKKLERLQQRSLSLNPLNSLSLASIHKKPHDANLSTNINGGSSTNLSSTPVSTLSTSDLK